MDEYDELGVEPSEVPADPVGRNVAIGVGGLIVIIVALVPLSAIAVTVGGYLIASMIALVQSGAAGY